MTLAGQEPQLVYVEEVMMFFPTHFGHVHVGARRGSRLWVDAQSVSGDLGSDMSVGPAPPPGEGPLVELRASTVSGDVHVARAPAPVA